MTFSENKQSYERNMECVYIYKYVAKAVSLGEAPTFWGNGELDKWTGEHRGGGGSRIRKKENPDHNFAVGLQHFVM